MIKSIKTFVGSIKQKLFPMTTREYIRKTHGYDGKHWKYELTGKIIWLKHGKPISEKDAQ
jgi:hypothetical protein